MRQRPWVGVSGTLALHFLAGALCAARAAELDTVDLGTRVPTVAVIQEKLFPDDDCERLKAEGFKCMGFAAPVRFSLPAASFKRGSAELPEGLKRQLDAFAQVLRGKSGAARVVRVEGHADALGAEALNDALSRERAEAARNYLMSRGVAAEQLKAVGMGSKALLDPTRPLAASNRRVVLGRDLPAASGPAP